MASKKQIDDLIFLFRSDGRDLRLVPVKDVTWAVVLWELVIWAVVVVVTLLAIWVWVG